MDVFSIGSQKARWLSARLGVIAGNVANASTPGYRAKEIAPFSAVMENRQVRMARTDPAHLNMAGQAAPARFEIREEEARRITHSGNSVSLEKEMLAGAETVRAYRLEANLVRSFHRMFLLGLRDG